MTVGEPDRAIDILDPLLSRPSGMTVALLKRSVEIAYEGEWPTSADEGRAWLAALLQLVECKTKNQTGTVLVVQDTALLMAGDASDLACAFTAVINRSKAPYLGQLDYFAPLSNEHAQYCSFLIRCGMELKSSSHL
jgi:hypothetical protein